MRHISIDRGRMVRTVPLALAACAVLAGCAGTGNQDTLAGADSSGLSGSAGTTASGYNDYVKERRESAGTANSGAVGPGTAGSSAMGSTPGRAESMAMERSLAGAAMPSWQGVVQAIEPIARRDTEIGASGAPGAAAAGGSVPGVGTDRAYRVTLRTDDGAMQSVVVQATPDYKVGDRVSYRIENGMGSISRQ